MAGIFNVTSICCDYHSTQLTLVLLCSPKVAPSNTSIFLYTTAPCYPQMNPEDHTIAFVLPRFAWSPTLSNILTMAFRVVYTQI